MSVDTNHHTMRLLFTVFILTVTILGSNICCLAQNLMPPGYSYESSINTNRVRYDGSIELRNFIYTYDKKYIILFHRQKPVEISFWNSI